MIRASNYFTFLEQYCAGDVTKTFPDRHAEVFDAFLAYLRGLTSKRLIVLDVKYNSTHHLTDVLAGDRRARRSSRLLKDQQIGVLHLTRRNLLRCLMSNLKAWQIPIATISSMASRRPTGAFCLPPLWALTR